MADAIDLTKEDAANDLQALEQQLYDVDEELQEIQETLQALHDRKQQLHQLKETLQRRISAEKRAPRADWSEAQFEWDSKLKDVLQAVFGLTAFRPLQREVMNASLLGRDVVLLLPSGGGKSLCYQLPALISGGVTLVVSPLLSLIVDQVMGLAGKVSAYALTSLSDKEESNAVMAALTAAAANPSKAQTSSSTADSSASTQTLLLYVTPEKVVASKRLMAKLEKIYQAGRLARIAIDEAHCCSTWGNDFRPDYKKLGVLKQQFPDTPIIALTATATVQVCQDIKHILRIDGAEQFTASINRPNLYYEVLRKAAGDAAADDISNWLLTNYPNGESGIVYCLTRKDCELLACQLQSAGITAAHYHADLEPTARTAAHNSWSKGDVQVMVATIAFGMGINKPDVRWVLHACLSKSLENYYQESDRAGRDGQPAHCVLYYRLSDVLRQASVVCMDPNWQQHLMAMTRYAAATAGCRRLALAAHFAEGVPPCHGMCDLCKAAATNSPAGDAGRGQQAGSSRSRAVAATGQADVEHQQHQHQHQQQQEDLTVAAMWTFSALQTRNKEKRATLNQLLDDMQKLSRKSGHGSGTPAGTAASKQELEWVVEQMLLQGLLAIEFGFTAYATNSYLVMTPDGEALFASQGQCRFTAARPRWLVDQQGSAAKAPISTASGGQKQGSQQRRQQQRNNRKRERSFESQSEHVTAVEVHDSDGP